MNHIADLEILTNCLKLFRDNDNKLCPDNKVILREALHNLIEARVIDPTFAASIGCRILG